MGWVIKDHYEDEYDFEMDRMNLESMDITAFSCPKLRIIEVPVDEDDLEKMEQIYELLFPGLFEDMEEMMASEDKDPYKVRYYYKVRKSDSESL
ncbi:hypothetical protein GHNINEIG_00548 [Hydrogenovibrio crunogenus]|uniref:Uncharacterized protein n=1 Tax=Hydrogenovibrio crunogenus TaxID=39765 RepID=A0A4P7NY39_9GAMM|nr:hypothetical protein [Hydrogenovibrio crunogenus]QBZ82518.1 hypothetical protein GHNINEIG_00548 [Hydrogenovibrio crunogenus]RUM92798.1 MAG: hypothetical protein DSZ27_02095 [Thiomicrospira sp.]